MNQSDPIARIPEDLQHLLNDIIVTKVTLTSQDGELLELRYVFVDSRDSRILLACSIDKKGKTQFFMPGE